MPASTRIEQYLEDHPDGELLIAVGYATPAGMAWLARRTQGRRVSLLIGDTRSQWWKRGSRSDRARCLEFIRRPDVEIRNWYRTKQSRSGESAAHLKVWTVHRNWSPVSALVGSGNLTHNGLDANVEVMAEAHGSDMHGAWDTVLHLWNEAWPCADKLVEDLGGPPRASIGAEVPRVRVAASAEASPTAPPPPPPAQPVPLPPSPIPGMSAAAGMGRRISGRFIDAGIALALMSLVGGSVAPERSAEVLIVGVLCYLTYEVLAVAALGTTLGKRVVGVRIMSARSGLNPTLGQSAGRIGMLAALMCVPLVGPFLCFASLLSGHGDQLKRGWHDRATKTLVLAAGLGAATRPSDGTAEPGDTKQGGRRRLQAPRVQHQARARGGPTTAV